MKLRFILALGLVLAVSSSVVGWLSLLTLPWPMPELPEPITIPLKVWVILAQGGLYNDPGIEEPGTPPEARTNRGCRFTEPEMCDRIWSLQSHAGLYGPWMQFSWDGQINVVPWVELALQEPEPPGDMGRHRSTVKFWEELIWEGGYHDPDKINVYFSGWVTPSRQSAAFGVTLEPNAAGIEPYIIINDAAVYAEQGFLFGNPDETLDWFVPEHEMTHYLARFENACYPLPMGQRCYDDGEHAPMDSNNILAPLPPSPLVIPGDFSDPTTEKGQIWGRVFAGDWNDP
jgi:hypothetical protein